MWDDPGGMTRKKGGDSPRYYTLSADQQLRARLGRAMLESGKNRNQIANEMGTNWNTLNNWMTGATKPNLELLVRFAQVTGVSMDELVPTSRDPDYSAWPAFLRALQEQGEVLTQQERESLAAIRWPEGEPTVLAYMQVLGAFRGARPPGGSTPPPST